MLLGLRLFISVYSIVFMCLSVYSYSDISPTSSTQTPKITGQWLLHITTWNYILSTIYFVLVIGIGVRELVQERGQTSHSSYSVISISPREYEDGDLTTTTTTPTLESAQRSSAAPGGIPVILVDGKELLFNYDGDSDYDTYDDDFVDSNDDAISVGYRIPIFYRFTYCVFNVTGNLAVVIALTYWAVLHDYDTPIYMNLTSLIQIDASVVILFWFLLEIAFNDIPTHILHFVFPIVITLLYFFVHVVYTMATGHVVYKNVNFLENPGYAAFFVVVLLTGIVMTQVVLYTLGQWKCHLADKLNRMRKESVS